MTKPEFPIRVPNSFLWDFGFASSFVIRISSWPTHASRLAARARPTAPEGGRAPQTLLALRARPGRRDACPTLGIRTAVVGQASRLSRWKHRTLNIERRRGASQGHRRLACVRLVFKTRFTLLGGNRSWRRGLQARRLFHYGEGARRWALGVRGF